GLTSGGFAGRISYDNSNGVTGQTLIIQNGANGGAAQSYTLLYNLADFGNKIATDTSNAHVALATGVADDGVVRANLRNGVFYGTFAGLGNSLSGLQLNGSSQTGMFQYTGSGAILRDLAVVNASVNGSYMTGTLVGQAFDGLTLKNLQVATTVTASGNAFTGGLVGYTDGGTLGNAYVSGKVRSNSSWVGGIFHHRCEYRPGKLGRRSDRWFLQRLDLKLRFCRHSGWLRSCGWRGRIRRML
ncbi:hypothetical protein EBZ70_12650, partial [bacterium]|nr:hypothetical protein [bacterium]